MEQLTTFGASGIKLAELQLFNGVAEHRALALLQPCPVMRLGAGKTAPASTDGHAQLYILLRGMLEVTHAATRADIPDRIHTRVLPGECVGELSVLDQEASSDRIVALQESDLLAIDATMLWRLIDESNGVARNLVRLLSFRIRAANAQLRRREKVGEFYRQLSMVDGLTGLQNRAWLNQHLPALVDDAHATGKPLSLIMVDIDHFKQFNDAHGHLQGDAALQTAARVITGTLRPTDFATRYGGEELLIILPGSHQSAALVVAQRLCDQIHQTIVFTDMRLPVPHITASLGLATLGAGQNVDMLVAAADAALYRAKEAGRNRVAT